MYESPIFPGEMGECMQPGSQLFMDTLRCKQGRKNQPLSKSVLIFPHQYLNVFFLFY